MTYPDHESIRFITAPVPYRPFAIEKPVRRIGRLLAKHGYVFGAKTPHRKELRNWPKPDLEALYFRLCAEFKATP